MSDEEDEDEDEAEAYTRKGSLGSDARMILKETFFTFFFLDDLVMVEERCRVS